jgi:hypothetical protein
MDFCPVGVRFFAGQPVQRLSKGRRPVKKFYAAEGVGNPLLSARVCSQPIGPRILPV